LSKKKLFFGKPRHQAEKLSWLQPDRDEAMHLVKERSSEKSVWVNNRGGRDHSDLLQKS
jgi:hypothetical protein